MGVQPEPEFLHWADLLLFPNPLPLYTRYEIERKRHKTGTQYNIVIAHTPRNTTQIIFYLPVSSLVSIHTTERSPRTYVHGITKTNDRTNDNNNKNNNNNNKVFVTNPSLFFGFIAWLHISVTHH